MDLQIRNNREIYPQKVSTKQGEVQTTVLKFKRSSCKYDDIDLRDYKAYAITSCNGDIDMTELTVESNSSGELILTWSLSERVLRYAGTIVYQIVFKADKDSPAKFYTYQAIIQNSESIDATNHLTANYPTIMKQWLNLIDARSGAVPHKVVYMMPGEPLPLDKRTAGTMYYQWEEEPYLGDVPATGIINLGTSPYADSGLYVNGKHIYVDNSSDTTFVLEPSLWVDAINAADCGVVASDMSDEEIKILITATEAGEVGNSITYELGLAQYGAGRGLQNPSGGSTDGSTLSGGYNSQTGVENPIGKFEDHFGNKLTQVDGVVSEIKYLASNNNPDGWLLCDGSEVNKSDYVKLYEAIGDTWGEASDSSKFKLPDLIGRVAWGALTAGRYIEAGLPEHNHDIGFTTLNSGAYGNKEISTSHAMAGFGNASYTKSSAITSEASVSNSIYGNSDTVQPPAATLRPFIKY